MQAWMLVAASLMQEHLQGVNRIVAVILNQLIPANLTGECQIVTQIPVEEYASRTQIHLQRMNRIVAVILNQLIPANLMGETIGSKIKTIHTT